jgi:hypothetical protein
MYTSLSLENRYKSDAYFTPCKHSPNLAKRFWRRKSLRPGQQEVGERSGITRELLVRFGRGQVSDFGSRKLLAVLAVLGLEMTFTEAAMSGALDELRRERDGA